MYNTKCNEKFAEQMANLSEIEPAFINYNLSEDEPDFTSSDALKVAKLNAGEKLNQGDNAADHTEAVHKYSHAGKLSVETTEDQVQDIKCIEDIPSYLNLLLLKIDKLPTKGSGSSI